MSYQIKTDYVAGTPVAPDDLNRRGQILQSQLPGALEAIGIGVVGAGDFLANATDVAAGIAIIRADDRMPVIVRSPVSLPIPARGDNEYLHLVLRVPEFEDGPGTNSTRGASPVLRVSEDEEEPDALLLAQWDGTQWVDRRPQSNAALLASAIAELAAHEARLDALETPGDLDPNAGVDGATFNAYKNATNAKLADLQAQIDALIAAQALASAGDTITPRLNLMNDQITFTAASLSEIHPHSIERGQIAVVTRGAGLGQNDTPVFAPTSGDPRELVFDPATFTLGADV